MRMYRAKGLTRLRVPKDGSHPATKLAENPSAGRQRLFMGPFRLLQFRFGGCCLIPQCYKRNSLILTAPKPLKP